MSSADGPRPTMRAWLHSEKEDAPRFLASMFKTILSISCDNLSVPLKILSVTAKVRYAEIEEAFWQVGIKGQYCR